MKTIILKIGGSVITKKAENKFSVKEDSVQRIATEIKNARQKEQFQLILVHGVGPFGHTLVTKYNINNGVKTREEVNAFIETHQSVALLNKIVVDIFKKDFHKLS